MTNPFDEKTQSEKHEFFKEMTSAINDWMLKEYPVFDTELINKIKELRLLQSEAKGLHEHILSSVEALKEKHTNYIRGQIDQFLKKEYPDISHTLVNTSKKLEKVIEKHESNVNSIKKKLEVVVKSDSIYEDVYKLRDEFKEIKTFMEGFKKKVKKAFEI